LKGGAAASDLVGQRKRGTANSSSRRQEEGKVAGQQGGTRGREASVASVSARGISSYGGGNAERRSTNEFEGKESAQGSFLEKNWRAPLMPQAEPVAGERAGW